MNDILTIAITATICFVIGVGIGATIYYLYFSLEAREIRAIRCRTRIAEELRKAGRPQEALDLFCYHIYPADYADKRPKGLFRRCSKESPPLPPLAPRERQNINWFDTRIVDFPYHATTNIAICPKKVSSDICLDNFVRVPLASRQIAVWGFPEEADREEFLSTFSGTKGFDRERWGV